jgi:hypothetical protein
MPAIRLNDVDGTAWAAVVPGICDRRMQETEPVYCVGAATLRTGNDAAQA